MLLHWMVLGILLFREAQCLVIPDDVASILSIIYFNIPPILKGTDSRLGVGFSLGRHADAQIVLELGPQTNTQALGTESPETNSDNKRRRYIETPSKNHLEYPKRQSNSPINSWLTRWRNTLSQARTPQKIKTMQSPSEEDKKQKQLENMKLQLHKEKMIRHHQQFHQSE